MSDLLQQIASFEQFARDELGTGTQPSSIDELYDRWRETHPLEADVLAVKASLRDLAEGEHGRSLEEFDQEFRRCNGLRSESE